MITQVEILDVVLLDCLEQNWQRVKNGIFNKVDQGFKVDPGVMLLEAINVIDKDTGKPIQPSAKDFFRALDGDSEHKKRMKFEADWNARRNHTRHQLA